MHPDQVWGNDEKYSKEFQIEFRRQCEEERKKNKEFWENYVDPNEEKYEATRKMMAEIRARQDKGEIINPFVREWLEGEITAARIAFAVGMILTALIKGQIVLWAIMYIAYRSRVKKATEDALEADRKR